MPAPAREPTAVTLLFGGPTDERGVSAGSIKPWVTCLRAEPGIALTVVFFDRETRAWRLPPRYEFANTCEDFEAQLGADERLDDAALDALLRAQDLVVPLVHGRFGEDGEVQERLERLGVEYLFGRPDSLAASLDKARCYAVLARAGLPVPRHVVVARADWRAHPARCFEGAHAWPARGERLAAVKPVDAGSSLGVSLSRDDAADFAAAMERAFEHGERALVEEVLGGTEFSTIVIEDADGRAVALAPTEVEKRAELYDTRSKYLQGEGAHLHTPLRDGAAIEPVRRACERAYAALGLRHMARVDGFLADDGTVLVTDVNGISGMSFSSFAFLQTSLVGLSHAELVRHLLRRGSEGIEERPRGRRLHVLFGGPTSERQVSRQSGVFAGLCLAARGFDVRFVLMDTASRFTEVGLFLALHHDVEEIQALVAARERRAEIARLAERIGAELGLDAARAARHLAVGPTTDLAGAVRGADFVFLGLHGGSGEDGTIQAALELAGAPYNGPDSRCSRLCSDKLATREALARADIDGVRVPVQRALDRAQMAEWLGSPAAPPTNEAWDELFASLCAELGSPALVCKPRADGCSTGVRLVRRGADLREHLRAVVSSASEYVPRGARAPLKLPVPSPFDWLLEQALVEPERIPLPSGDKNATRLREWFERKRFVELTCAVLELDGELRAAVPSVTVAAGEELSLDEKFQQGQGTNIELDQFLPAGVVDSLRRRVVDVARALGITGYSRVDAFYDRSDGSLWPIEANTLCGLTEATVFYTQALSSFGLSPPEALERIVEAGFARAASRASNRGVESGARSVES